jgi:hypothetical protein
VPDPLKKQKPDGSLYTRQSHIEKSLGELSRLSRPELLSRCEVLDRRDPNYVPSECLMHFVRACRHDNSEANFEALYKILRRRVIAALPCDEIRVGNKDVISLTKNKTKERANDRLTLLLCKDRQEYSETLDFFEIRFDGAVANLRRDAQDRAWREENRTVPLEHDEDTGEVSPEVERAKGSYNPLESEEINNWDYRLRLDAAIDTLPPEQSRVIQMLRQGFLMDSKDPNVMTISKALDITEKTVRNRRDRAFVKLRKVLLGEGS